MNKQSTVIRQATANDAKRVAELIEDAENFY